MQLTNLLITTFTQMLRALSAWLKKAEAQARASGETTDALLSKRLADDMFPLSSQIYLACFQAQEAIYRFRGEALPEAVDAVRHQAANAVEGAITMADAQARLAEALAQLESLGPDAFEAGAESPIILALPQGLTFDMTAEQCVRDWTLPQFYFHLNIAYAILRSEGIELGKPDYVAHMFPYLRS
jgi:hypothetical protein